MFQLTVGDPPVHEQSTPVAPVFLPRAKTMPFASKGVPRAAAHRAPVCLAESELGFGFVRKLKMQFAFFIFS